MKFASARIVTRDVEARARFYEDVTGALAVGSEEYVEIRTTGATLAISSARTASMFGAGTLAPAMNRSVILDFEVDDVDAERARLRDVVGDWVLQPTTQPWGNRSMMFRDPDGNVINVYARAAAGAMPSDMSATANSTA